MIGEFYHTVDAKGRMNFPAKLREELGDNFIIARTIGAACLTVYSNDNWEEFVKLIQSKPRAKRAAIERFVIGGARNAEADKQGRILIPQPLREYAGLDGDVVVVGLSDRAEIWNKSTYDEMNSAFSMEQLEADALELEL